MQKINKIHQRTLHVIIDDYNSAYKKLLASYNGFLVCQKRLKHLTVEVVNEPEPRNDVAILQKSSCSTKF